MAENGRDKPRRDGNRGQATGKSDGRGGPPRKPRRQDQNRSGAAGRGDFGGRGDSAGRSDSRGGRGGTGRGDAGRGGWKAGGRQDRQPRESEGRNRPPRNESWNGKPASERPSSSHNPRDLRSSNREDRERSPEIDPEVTGKELDKVTKAQLRNLEERNAEWISRHLVMAGRLVDEDPELAFQHALAASRRGGRLALVREAVGLTAYAAGRYGEALREFRTFRRITGSNEHLPVMVDCERGLGRPDKALEAARAEEAKELDTAGKVELAIVVAGARADLEQYEAAVTALEIPQLDRTRAFSFSPRLFRAYADALENAGRGEEADGWRRTANIAEEALGVGDFADPDIIDLTGDEDADGGSDGAHGS